MPLTGIRGRCAALVLCLLAVPAQAGELVLSLADSGEVLGRFVIEDGDRWSILWNHSVQGFEVEDVYESRDGAMVLVRSHLPDFAAGLGHIPGRGIQTSDGAGGYWIEDIDEAVPGNAYILRPGPPSVNHRLRTPLEEISLTDLAERARLRIALVDDAP